MDPGGGGRYITIRESQQQLALFGRISVALNSNIMVNDFTSQIIFVPTSETCCTSDQQISKAVSTAMTVMKEDKLLHFKFERSH